ncbi:MAG: ABC transporter permease [Clostridia bacterium]|nr:ABC transporter permease [Clostridia bacterium]
MEKTKSIIKVSIKNIISNKLRSSLTMLGLIIGIISVILLVGIGSGATTNVTSEVKSLGTGTLTVTINSNADATLEYSQMDEILEINNVESVAPYKNVSGTVSRGTTTSKRASILATTPQYMSIMNLTISDGRLLSNIDLNNYSKICLIGSDLAESLFEGTKTKDIVGQSLKIEGDNYTIVGILTSAGSSMGNNIDTTLIIPFTTAKYLKGDTSISNLYVKVADEKYIDRTTTLIENYISSTLSISTDYFTVSSQDSMLDTMSNISNTLSLLLGGIAGISLIVGGIGVMNVMLVSVTERTKEIGIRKALGAKRMDILVQFLVESLMLCVLGGTIGVGLGLGIGKILQTFGFNFSATSGIVIISFASSALIGVVFGIFPAYKASKLNPIDALRTD